MLLKNAVIFNEEFETVKADILTEADRISAVGMVENAANESVFDLTGMTILPGFIDMHIHGCANADVGDAAPDTLETMSANLVKHGVTSFCPTSMTLSLELLQTVFANVRDTMNDVSGAYVQGINMEGPYIAMSKRGAQNPAYVRNPDKDEFRRLYDECGGIVRVVDIAPECEGGLEFIREVSAYCPVAIAHTAADYDEAKSAIEAGAGVVTHLYNAQSGLAHREPGVVGAAFDMAKSHNVYCELICDGHHIHPAALRIAFSQVGEDHSVIVSDSCEGADCPDGEYEIGGQKIFVRDGLARLESGTIAASTSNLHQELKNVISYGVPVKQAVKSVSINPAKAIRVDHETGSIAVGKRADLVVVDADWNIKMVIVRGEIKVNNL
ncbi:MAG: N-acetylglucosamine-6-phosphate deacetylase [Clostridia bacterium]|nr:N-acetylglucosamine-6-phosphate deacetylase [Clostridia bacterium]